MTIYRNLCVHLDFLVSNPMFFFVNRINKKGSQKDAEQKKAGNYFFYDDDEAADVDDDDL